MACPACGCKVHYQYDDADCGPDDECVERCAACRHIFHIEDAAEDDDDEECGGASLAVEHTEGKTNGQ